MAESTERPRKRPVLLDPKLCMICQQASKQKLMTVSSDGLPSVNTIRQLRSKLSNDNFREATDRLTGIFRTDSPPPFLWHKDCRSSYMSKCKVERLRNAALKEINNQCSSASTSTHQQNVSLRSKTPQIDWRQCIFCQKAQSETLHLIQEMKVSRRILEAAKYDQILRVQLACVNDLTAADGTYHRSCIVQFERRTKRIANISPQSSDITLAWLCQELEQSAEQGDILDLVNVWERYCTIASNAEIDIPPSFLSRRNTFKDKIADRLEGLFEVVVLHDQPRNEPRTVLVPTKFRHIPVSAMVKDSITDKLIPSLEQEDTDTFLTMVHVALQIRGDMLSHPKPEGIDISEDRAINSIPDSLYMFLNLLLGGQRLLEEDELDDDKNEARRRLRIISIAQDLMYTANGDKFLTPKHIGLASTLHQATRSKELVNMFHNAGHVMSYRDVIKLDTALAKKTLETIDDDGSVVPQNLVKGRYVHFSTDNVDINEYTLDGKGTFHATQVAAWQRGPPEDDILNGIDISKTGAIQIPEAMTDLIPASNRGITERQFSGLIAADCFTQSSEDCLSAQNAHATDMAFILSRSSHKPMPSWTLYNQKASTVNPEKTTVGYLPIIQNPASELETLNTVVKRVLHVAKSMEQKHVVLTVDEALYPKLLELKWSVEEYKDVLIPCLGGLHIAMNFLGVIGRHMSESGLSELWVGCDLLGANAAQNVMKGKGYARAIRTHKLTLQALWQLLLPRLYTYLDGVDVTLRDELSNVCTTIDTDHIAQIVNKLTTDRFQQPMKEFPAALAVDDPNAEFWWNYMTMVSILLCFTRAQRDGSWDLHLYAFKRMLPFLFRYDHVNYARWGTVYLAEMSVLPPEVLHEFQEGNFVVKRANRRFNQVSADQSTEWLNATGKKSGGLVGITRIASALSRWTLSYNLRTVIASQTKTLLSLTMDDEDDEYTHNECTKCRMEKDDSDEGRLVVSMKQHGVFQDGGGTLQNIITKDVVTPVIQESLLSAEKLGQAQMTVFVNKRLCEPPESNQHLDLKSPIQKNNAKTFASLYEVVKPSKSKQNTIKVDRNILQRLLTAYKAGREVNLENILQHELMTIPLSLATTSGSLHSTNKSVLANILTQQVQTPANVTLNQPSCLLIDGQALVMAVGKPPDIRTFGDYANTFANTVFKMGAEYQRIDVVFDRYQGESIKAGTRTKRKQRHRPVRRVIENESSVPLPSDWSSFMALEENKADLAQLLSNHLIEYNPTDKPVVVVAGGFAEATTVKSSDPDLEVSSLRADHEEADTRLILHCIHANMKTIVVSVRDTDVLLLLLAHYDRMGCTSLYMKAGTSKAPKYFPVHEIRNLLSPDLVDTLLAFHAVTGCDSVSQFSCHGKKTAWKVFEQHHTDLVGLGRGPLTKEIAISTEKFICKIYGVPKVDTCNKARVKLFCIGHAQETLPPTSDAAKFHIMRSHYQASVWNQAHLPHPDLPPVTEMGWMHLDGQLVPRLLSLPPIPKACREITSCGCTKGCLSLRCSCRKARMKCIEACNCRKLDDNCRNTHDDQE